MVHCIQTSFGDSEGTYGGDDYPDWRAAPQGVLQGNACGLAIWSVLSSVVFEILQSRGFSVEFCGTMSKSILKLWATLMPMIVICSNLAKIRYKVGVR